MPLYLLKDWSAHERFPASVFIKDALVAFKQHSLEVSFLVYHFSMHLRNCWSKVVVNQRQPLNSCETCSQLDDHL